MRLHCLLLPLSIEALGVAGCAGPESSSAPPPPDTLISEADLDHHLDTALTGYKTSYLPTVCAKGAALPEPVGLAIVLVRNGTPYYLFRGPADLGGEGRPEKAFAADTIFPIASLTKTLTSILFSELVLQNEAAGIMDQPASMLAPPKDAGDLTRGYFSKIRMADLADFYSGLPRDPPDEQMIQDRKGLFASLAKVPQCTGDIMACCKEAPNVDACAAATPPGGDYRYSNYSFALLGEIVAQRLGETSWVDATAKYVTGPIGLDTTDTKGRLVTKLGLAEFQARRAIGYAYDGSDVPKPTPEVGTVTPFPMAGGALWSTPEDMRQYLYFLMSLLGNGLPQNIKDARQRSLQPVSDSESPKRFLGWKSTEVSVPVDGKLVSHHLLEKPGSAVGYYSYIAFVTDLPANENLGIMMMSNREGCSQGDNEWLGRQMLSTFL